MTTACGRRRRPRPGRLSQITKMPMETADLPCRKAFPIGYVALATGLSPHVIRVWERRYQAVAPEREGKGRRLYSRQDIEHLNRLKRARMPGRRIGALAMLDEDSLRRMERDGSLGVDGPRSSAIGNPPFVDPSEILSECETAVRGMDAAALALTLRRADTRLSRTTLLTEVVAVLMHRIGDEWSAKRLGIMHEHFASNVVRGFLSDLLSRMDPGEHAPHMVVATPAGQHCELGAMTAAVAAADLGWKVFYFGSNLPCEEIAAAAALKKAQAVCLSITCRSKAGRTGRELIRLQKLLGEDTWVLIGGQLADRYMQNATASNFRFFSGVPEFSKFISRSEPAVIELGMG